MRNEVLFDAIVDGDEDVALNVTEELLQSDSNPADIVGDTLIPAMDKVAELWKEGDYFMSDVILSANAFGKSMEAITPAMEKTGYQARGKYMIGVVEGDMHDLGKNIVSAMMRANGFQVIDLGVDVHSDAFVAAVKEHKPDILGIGAYMSTTMDKLKEVIDALKAAGIREGMLIEAGGVCVTENTALNAGADVFGGDAMNTVKIAIEYMEGKS